MARPACCWRNQPFRSSTPSPVMAEIMKTCSKDKRSVICAVRAQQGCPADQVDLVQDQGARALHLRQRLPSASTSGSRPRLASTSMRDEIRVRGAGPGGGHHRPLQPAARRKDAGRIHQNHLGRTVQHDPAHDGARGLHLVGHDGDLGAHQRIGQRGLARIGRTQQGNEAAARRAFRRSGTQRLRDGSTVFIFEIVLEIVFVFEVLVGGLRPVRPQGPFRRWRPRFRRGHVGVLFGRLAPLLRAHASLPSDTPSRARKAAAAAFCASCLEFPNASEPSRPGSSTATTKRGAWSGPLRETSR